MQVKALPHYLVCQAATTFVVAAQQCAVEAVANNVAQRPPAKAHDGVQHRVALCSLGGPAPGVGTGAHAASPTAGVHGAARSNGAASAAAPRRLLCRYLAPRVPRMVKRRRASQASEATGSVGLSPGLQEGGADLGFL